MNVVRRSYGVIPVGSDPQQRCVDCKKIVGRNNLRCGLCAKKARKDSHRQTKLFAQLFARYADYI